LAEGTPPIRPYFPFRKCHARDPFKRPIQLAFYKFLRPGVEKRFAEISDFAGCAQEHVPVYVYWPSHPLGLSAKESTLYTMMLTAKVDLARLPERLWEGYNSAVARCGEAFCNSHQKEIAENMERKARRWAKDSRGETSEINVLTSIPQSRRKRIRNEIRSKLEEPYSRSQ